jgi:hypothetical protein
MYDALALSGRRPVYQPPSRIGAALSASLSRSDGGDREGRRLVSLASRLAPLTASTTRVQAYVQHLQSLSPELPVADVAGRPQARTVTSSQQKNLEKYLGGMVREQAAALTAARRGGDRAGSSALAGVAPAPVLTEYGVARTGDGALRFDAAVFRARVRTEQTPVSELHPALAAAGELAHGITRAAHAAGADIQLVSARRTNTEGRDEASRRFLATVLDSAATFGRGSLIDLYA